MSEQDIRIERLESDVKEIREDVQTFRDHVVKCEERAERREQAEKQERIDRKEREERYWKVGKVFGFIALGLLAMTGHDEAWSIIRAMIGG